MLIDGTTRPAGELAYGAGISAQSASGHLAKLVDGGLLEAEAQGRHLYYRIAGAEVAAMLESMASVGAGKVQTPRPPLPPTTPVRFLYARTCYGHLAGEMAVNVLSSMIRSRWLAPRGTDYDVTARGERELTNLGINIEAARRSRRVFARACVDLTQRRPHLGGALGDALLQLYVGRGWIHRSRRSRAVEITTKGQEAFRRAFNLGGLERVQLAAAMP
jgi:DNA-binding transcriptional ArsR family regulator